MPEFPAPDSPVTDHTLAVSVEAVAWVTQFVGGDGTRRKAFTEALAPGATVRSALADFSRRHPALLEALWDRDHPTELSEHLEVLVNDAVLGLSHTLDSPLQDGDRITLVGQYAGG
jgi:molybdopterin converting factor small subunit